MTSASAAGARLVRRSRENPPARRMVIAVLVDASKFLAALKAALLGVIVLSCGRWWFPPGQLFVQDTGRDFEIFRCHVVYLIAS